MKFVRLIVLASLVLLIAACSTINSTERESEMKLNFPLANYTNLLNIKGRLTAFAIDVLKPDANLISYAYQDDSEIRILELPRDNACRNKTAYWGFETLPDGRIGMIKDCFGAKATADNPLGDYRYMVAYNWDDKSIEYVINQPLLNRLSVASFSWNPDMTKGVQEKFGSGQGTIFWISPTGTSPMDIEVEAQGTTWNLKDYFNHDDTCAGLAEKPAWSPDGKVIAFFASGEAKLLGCKTHTTFRSNLFIMDPIEEDPIMVAENFWSPYQLTWSFNGNNLAFWGCSDSSKKCGIWVYSRKHNKVDMISQGNFIDLTWTTDFNIAALKCDEDFCNGNTAQVLEYSFDDFASP